MKNNPIAAGSEYIIIEAISVFQCSGKAAIPHTYKTVKIKYIDKHTKSLITDNIKLLLDYCERFYDRQFETRENVNLDILARFEQTLDDYLASNLPISKGTPTVQYCADKLCLSANYLSDLLTF